MEEKSKETTASTEETSSKKQQTERLNADINLRSEEVQELMGEIPPLIQRVGITVIFVIVLAILGVCAFVHCPETTKNGKVIYSDKTLLEKILEK